MDDDCPVARILGIIGKKWTLRILYEIKMGDSVRFTDLMSSSHGLSARTLTKRLSELERSRLIKRVSYKEIPPRVEYSLTDQGKKLMDISGLIAKWAMKWDATS